MQITKIFPTCISQEVTGGCTSTKSEKKKKKKKTKKWHIEIQGKVDPRKERGERKYWECQLCTRSEYCERDRHRGLSGPRFPLLLIPADCLNQFGPGSFLYLSDFDQT